MPAPLPGASNPRRRAVRSNPIQSNPRPSKPVRLVRGPPTARLSTHATRNRGQPAPDGHPHTALWSDLDLRSSTPRHLQHSLRHTLIQHLKPTQACAPLSPLRDCHFSPPHLPAICTDVALSLNTTAGSDSRVPPDQIDIIPGHLPTTSDSDSPLHFQTPCAPPPPPRNTDISAFASVTTISPTSHRRPPRPQYPASRLRRTHSSRSAHLTSDSPSPAT